MKPILFLLAAFAVSASAFSQDWIDAIHSRCMQRITVYDPGSDEKIQWQQRNCQSIWSEAKSRQEKEIASAQCYEFKSISGLHSQAVVKLASGHCTDASN